MVTDVRSATTPRISAPKRTSGTQRGTKASLASRLNRRRGSALGPATRPQFHQRPVETAGRRYPLDRRGRHRKRMAVWAGPARSVVGDAEGDIADAEHAVSAWHNNVGKMKFDSSTKRAATSIGIALPR